MNTRERFVRVLTGRPVDRVPFMKVFGGTNHVLPQWEQEYPGLRERIDRICGFEGRYRGWACTPVNMDLSCVSQWKTVEEDEEKRIARRPDGTVSLFHKGNDYHRQTLEYPVKTARDWERIKAEFLDPDAPGRFPANWPEHVAAYRNRDYPLQLTHRGVYGFARLMMGDENLAYAFYDAPSLVHDIMDSYTSFAFRVWERMTEDIQFDLIECWEDMASKNGALISPLMFREFMAPNYRRIRAFAAAHGIEIVLVDSDGYIMDLAPLMQEAGVNAMYPFEVLAGNDLERLRATLPDMGAIGALSKEVMAEGPDAVEREMEKARRLIRLGRFIPGPDHFVLSYASWPQYRHFMERLRTVVLTTPPSETRQEGAI
ncbi:MAG: hypothetical protein GXP31_09705 [Kiritimatiellaeota bacterium]|nr:hypothetical protein [Kiritimatiellota bacterium]